jgi:hypothetical protein
MKRISGYIAVALCAPFTMWAGTVYATLIGDTVTVGHYAPDTTTPPPGATPPASLTVEAGTADVYTFYNSYPFGYRVNVEAASILVDFNYLFGAAGTWADSYSGLPICTTIYDCTFPTIPMSFNGLGVSGLNDSSGNALQGVTVDTNMASWDTSRLSFGNDSVLFDWKGLSFDNTTYFNATLDFGQAGGVISAVPEPETYAMLLAGLGLIGFSARRRKEFDA